MIRFC